MSTPRYDYIDNVEQLNALCAVLDDKDWVCIDTEFIREKTFLPELCLVQVKSGDSLAIIDTLKIQDLTALSRIMHNEAITKVFHAGSQDLEIFYWIDKRVPAPVFDTQIAAPVLGFAEQIGYGNLVSEYLGVELDKAHSRADWSRRPLPDSQLKYALDDVIYLEKMYQKMTRELSTRKRLDWIQPELDAVLEPTRYDKPPSERWKKMRAAQKMKGPALSVLQTLTVWREEEALRSNIPRNWLLKDDVLVAIAREQPKNKTDLGHIRGLGSRIKSGLADKLLDQINTALTRPPEPMPAVIKKKKLKPAQLATVDLLSAIVTLRASELDINPSVLASRKDLETCVSASDSSGLKGWRHKLLANDVDSLLSGKSRLRVESTRLVIEPTA